MTLSLASVLLAAATWQELSRRLDANRAMVNTARHVDELLKVMLAIESAQRGFTLTGDETFLQPLIAGEAAVPSLLAKLRTIGRENPRLLREIAELGNRVELCLESYHQIIEARRNEGLARAIQLVSSREGSVRMDVLRSRVESIQNLSPDRAETGNNDTKGQLLRAGLTSLSAGVVGIGAGVYAFWLARMMLGHKERERRLVEARLQAERSSREKETSGTGLGLSIVQRLTEMMGGSVHVTSVLGQGSTFRLEFRDVPVSSTRTVSSEPLETSFSVSFDNLTPSTILVVDDNETNRQLVEGIFARTRHRLILAADGLEALKKAEADRPDVILLDLRMPGMDGREALPALRKIRGLESTPIIAVTASTLLNEERNLRGLFSGYIRKPFSRRGLYEELAKVILPAPDGAEVPMPTLPTPVRPAPGEAAPELIERLEQLQSEVWPTVQATGAFGETRRFAATLMELARAWNCPYLEAYSLDLARHAESYALVELEQSLARFASLVDELKKHRTS